MVRLRRLTKTALGPMDLVLAIGSLVALPTVFAVSRARGRAKISRRLFDLAGVSLVPHQYYEPITIAKDLRRSCDEPRPLPGVDLRVDAQRALISKFDYGDELKAIPYEKQHATAFGYQNASYGVGDAEMLYNMIRHFKPRCVIEIGSGESTLVARMAIRRVGETQDGYKCKHICIEPYENPWLEQIRVEVVRERIELQPPSLFEQLGENDILFIDSSHVIRPQGDVLFEILEVVPSLARGVLVHIHDIRTPRDYPTHWITDIRRMWDEQYLLEAFLSNNRDFEVVAASNMLAAEYPEEFAEACPVWGATRNREPSSFWIRRI
jgi:hypothetical protein